MAVFALRKPRVTLPKIAAVPPPKTPKERAREEARSARIRMQALAVGLFLILTIGVVLAVALLNQPGGTFRQQPRPATQEMP